MIYYLVRSIPVGLSASTIYLFMGVDTWITSGVTVAARVIARTYCFISVGLTEFLNPVNVPVVLSMVPVNVLVQLYVKNTVLLGRK